MKTIKGNLLDLFDDGEFDTIVHGCNTKHDMSGGIALQIANRYPIAERVDDSCWHGIGFYSVAILGNNQKIINAYTQVHPGRDARLVSVMRAFKRMKENGQLEGNVGIPMIGAGIGGLEWSDVDLVLNRLDLPNVTVVEFG